MFKPDWHPARIAVEWPRGSVVLVRVKQPSPLNHEYSYILSLYFSPQVISSLFGGKGEFMLIEQPQRKETK